MFYTNLKLAANLIAVLATLVVSGMFLNQAHATERKAKPGESIEAEDGDVVIVDLTEDATPDKATKKKVVPVADKGHSGEPDKPKAEIKPAFKQSLVDYGERPVPHKPEPVAPPAPKIMADDFSAPKADDEVDQDSVVELAVRANLSPTGPAIGGALGFSYRPANRVRVYTSFNAGKGLTELKEEEKELLQFGFNAGLSRVVTKTVEVGLFGTMSWSYRELTKATATSFLGIGPGFRVNKLAGLVFFEAGIPIGFSKKFADGSWDWSTSLQASAGVHL